MKNEDRATTSAKGGLRPATVKGGSKQPTRRGNILDLLILFILVAALIGIGYRYYTKSNPSRAQELSEVEIAFEIRDAVFTLPSYVKTGDVLYFEDGTVFGTIKNNSPEEDNTALYVQSAAVIVSDESGNYIRREDYTACMCQYVECVDEEGYGVYPMTEDLYYMLRNGGEHYGWWDSTHPNYLFTETEGLNTEIAWMFCCCYIQ